MTSEEIEGFPDRTMDLCGAEKGPLPPVVSILPIVDGCYCAEPEFYMVWTKRGTKPSCVHHRRSTAEAEAIRLAKKYPGQKFMVLSAVLKFWAVEAPDAQTVEAVAV